MTIILIGFFCDISFRILVLTVKERGWVCLEIHSLFAGDVLYSKKIKINRPFGG